MTCLIDLTPDSAAQFSGLSVADTQMHLIAPTERWIDPNLSSEVEDIFLPECA
ncbi:hypothetical protein [Hyphomonas sp.]|jgi:hypothetical protein|uniref:hypothetical protein n=1 Tax=Hyphomonas sp. TaxID=87 RepID=UPI0039E699C2